MRAAINLKKLVKANLNKNRRAVLRGFTAEQKRQYQIERMRELRRRNPQKSRASCKAYRQKLRLKSKHGENTIKFRKPHYQCVGCLYKIGFALSFISNKLRMTYGNVGVTISRCGIAGKRVPSRHSQGCGKRGPRPKTEKMILRLITRSQQKEIKALARFDESNHWRTHPERVVWSNENSRQKKYEARLKKFLSKFKCKGCGCGASALAPERQRFGIQFCSDKCSSTAELARIQSDPELWQRRSEIRKRCYHRKRKERPEVYRDEIRRKLANPQYRIAKAHRTRIYLLVAEGKMKKTKTSLKYFGCSQAYLKKHLVSQFKPGMTWENYGKVWEVDHIIPLSRFNLLDAVECSRAFHWSNLQPMFPIPNRRKSAKITNPQQSLPFVVY